MPNPLNKYVGPNRLSEIFGYIKAELDKKVTVVSGKGLSSNDYTTTEKNKLSGIASGAEVNVQSNWNESSSSSDAYILNKPTKLSQFTDDVVSGHYLPLTGGSLTGNLNVSGSSDTSLYTHGDASGSYIGFRNQSGNTTFGYIGVKNDNLPYFYSNGSKRIALLSEIPTKVSQLTNDSGYTTNIGTVTQVKVGSTAYNPSSGVVSLPAYPTTLPASDVSAWAKAATKPSYTASEVSALPYKGNLRTEIGSNTPAAATKTYWENSIAAFEVSGAYDNAGTEYTLLFSKGGNNNYGTVLKWGYNDKYLYMLRMYNTWQDSDWAKIHAGYADTAGSASTVGSSTVGGTTTPIYLNAGTPTALSYTISKSVPSTAVFTDVKVTQTESNGSSYNSNYEILFSNSTTDNDSTLTEGARKSKSFAYNPYSGLLTAYRLYTSGGRDNVAIRFRDSDSTNYSSWISHMSDGNEALVIGVNNSVTSIMLVNGIKDSDVSSSAWKSITSPGIQVKNNCVSIGELITNGTTPTYTLNVGGSFHAKSLIEVGVASSQSGQLKFFNSANSYYAAFSTQAWTANRTYTLPNATGTLALTSDITDRIKFTQASVAEGTGWRVSNAAVTITSGTWFVFAYGNFSGTANAIEGVSILIGSNSTNQAIINMNYNQATVVTSAVATTVTANTTVKTQVYSSASKGCIAGIFAIKTA